MSRRSAGRRWSTDRFPARTSKKSVKSASASRIVNPPMAAKTIIILSPTSTRSIAALNAAVHVRCGPLRRVPRADWPMSCSCPVVDRGRRRSRSCRSWRGTLSVAGAGARGADPGLRAGLGPCQAGYVLAVARACRMADATGSCCQFSAWFFQRLPFWESLEAVRGRPSRILCPSFTMAAVWAPGAKKRWAFSNHREWPRQVARSP
jgi:hypothetical protein